MDIKFLHSFNILINFRFITERKFTGSQCHGIDREYQRIINKRDNQEQTQNQESQEQEHQLDQKTDFIFEDVRHADISPDIGDGLTSELDRLIYCK